VVLLLLVEVLLLLEGLAVAATWRVADACARAKLLRLGAADKQEIVQAANTPVVGTHEAYVQKEPKKRPKHRRNVS
jgi:hypothetical protein